MITLIYGDNLSESRKYLQTLKTEDPNTLTVAADEVNLSDLSQIFDGQSLFHETKTVALEDFLSKSKKGKEKDAIISYLSSKESEHTILFWESKDVSKTTISLFSRPVLKQFSFPQTLFQFLDSILPNNASVSLKLFGQAQKTTEPELLFFMLVRHVRLLISSLNDDSHIDEWKRAAPWQKTKLTKQAKAFGHKRLMEIHKDLFSLEQKQKTGTLTLSLSGAIDFFLVSL